MYVCVCVRIMSIARRIRSEIRDLALHDVDGKDDEEKTLIHRLMKGDDDDESPR